MKTVLYADDNQEIIEIVKLTVERAGYQLLTARDGGEAVHICQEQNPDMVLMDINMPGLNGFDAVRQLREDGFNNPVIFLTASEIRQDRDAAYAAGCDDFVLKTADMAEVENVVLRYLGDGHELL
jgi:CheY-like chemotaxis protein